MSSISQRSFYAYLKWFLQVEKEEVVTALRVFLSVTFRSPIQIHRPLYRVKESGFVSSFFFFFELHWWLANFR